MARKQQSTDQEDVSPPGGADRKGAEDSSQPDASAMAGKTSDIPRWRRVEMLREMAELKDNLQEVWDDDIDDDP